MLLAALAGHYAQSGIVVILVDTRKLAKQLARTVEWFTGIKPGIEMGDMRARFDAGLAGHADRIIISTPQTLYAGGEGSERKLQFESPSAPLSMLLLDECESFLAIKNKALVEYFMAAHPTMKVFGTTATPERSDGVAMANLFQSVAFTRPLLWGVQEAWLIKPRMAFVNVLLDPSTWKLRKNEDGELDYVSDEIAQQLVNNEEALIGLARGILEVAGDRKSIVVCPDVASAKAIEHYLDAERRTCARSVYGELPEDEKEAVMDAHQRGDFQFLVSVMMLTKGYDDRTIRAVFMCRKTKSRRLYVQVMGRGTRPDCEGLNDAASADERRAMIAASVKPDVLMVNMVGIGETVRDVTVIDVLGSADDQAIIDRAKEIAAEQGIGDVEEAIAAAQEEVEEARQIERMDAEKRASKEEAAEARKLEEELQRRQRRTIDVNAEVQVEYQDDLQVRSGSFSDQTGGIPPRQMNILKKAKLSDSEIAKLSPVEASAISQDIVRRWKSGLCTYKQDRLLRRHGYSPDELRGMKFEHAHQAMQEIAENGWKRPMKAGAA